MTSNNAEQTSNERSNDQNERILILAPTGRDAEMTARVLTESGLKTEICRDVADVCLKMNEDAGLLFLTGEALTPSGLPDLIAALAAQPTWSDLPLIVLTSGGGDVPFNAEVLDALSEAGNVTLVERPIRLKTLVSTIKAALRARRRQYDIRDHIAEEKRITVELAKLFQSEREARAEAEAANRLKDEFLATVSHELRTPLNAMLGWTALLRTGDLDSEKTSRALETVERNARSQAQIIEDLLDVSRIITGKLSLELKALDAGLLVESAVNSISPTAAAKNIVIKTVIAAGTNQITGDSSRLQQVLWNLLSNAVKFTAAGGEIEVEVKREKSFLAVSVSDTGNGIAPEFLPFVFERFRQADGTTTRNFGGLGLGLAIVRHLVEQHGGSVYAASAGIGKGATFIIKLPLSSNAQANGKAPVSNSNNARDVARSIEKSLVGLKILVVDDDVDALDLVRIFLESSGAQVTAAHSVAEALENIARAVPDVIVSDIGMPGANGYEFIEKVRRLAPEKGGVVPAVALTAYARIQDRDEALRCGFQTHVAKPVEMEELVSTIVAVAARLPNGN